MRVQKSDVLILGYLSILEKKSVDQDIVDKNKIKFSLDLLINTRIVNLETPCSVASWLLCVVHVSSV